MGTTQRRGPGRPKGSKSKTARPRTKTENLTLTISPRTRFLLDSLARSRRQNMTPIVEQALEEFASKPENRVDLNGESKTLLDLWHPHEGVRTVRTLQTKTVPPTTD